MSYFKKFTDFCAGVAAFVASLLLIRDYMDFSPDKENPAKKLTQFLEDSATNDYKMLIFIVLLLVLSVLLGILFRKLPYVCLAFSIIPAVYICVAFQTTISASTTVLYEQEPLFLVVAALHVIGNLAECIFRDREDGGHRLFIASKISLVMGALVCFYMTMRLNEDIPLTTEGLNAFEKNMISYKREIAIDALSSSFDASIIAALGWMLLIFALVGIALYNVYFVDAILSFVSLGYVIVSMMLGKLTFYPLLFLFIAAMAVTSNVMLAVFENNLSKKEQRRSE